MSNVITFPLSASTSARATYSIEEVMELTGLGRGLVYAALQTGEIPARKVGSRWLISRELFHAWLNSSTNDQKGTA